MTEAIKLILTSYGLCIQFQDLEKKRLFLNEMQKNGLNLFTEETGNHCYIKAYTHEEKVGGFLSEHGRVGLAFPSEKLKFFFKERIGLPGDYLMDMGPGYETQIHFNEAILPYIENASIITTR